jgi:PPM family protein phosphatase
MQTANLELRQMVADSDGNGRMATTMVAAVRHDENQATLANVGDSRGYLLRDGRLRQITKDQSLVARLVEEGAITAEEALHHPRKNVILHSLGSENAPPIDQFRLLLQAGDILVLCSDGLTRHVSDEEIAAMALADPPETATEKLIRLANERGGEDNISVALLRLAGAAEPDHAALKTPPAPLPQATLPTKQKRRASSRLLWLYTIFLCLVQTVAIVLIWLALYI